jgi:hypothetical protein
MSDQYILSIERTCKQVKKDSAVLVHVMHILCVLENLVLAFRTSINRGNYFELLKVGSELRCWS